MGASKKEFTRIRQEEEPKCWVSTYTQFLHELSSPPETKIVKTKNKKKDEFI